MSLINDALKTAQRERRTTSGPANSSLIEGFFPFVSTSSQSPGGSKRVIIGAVAAVVILAVGGYVAAPIIRSMAGDKPGPTIQLPPRQAQAPAPVSNASSRGAAPDSQTVAVETAVATSRDQSAAEQTPSTADAPRPRPGRTDAAGSGVRAAAPQRSNDSTAARNETVTRAPEGSRAASITPDHEVQAAALFNAGDFDGARAQFQLAIRSAPTARVWTNYGVTLQRLGDLNGAKAAYQAATGLDASYLEAWLFHARVLMQMGQPAAAVPVLQRARAIDPRHSGVNADLAQLESDAHNYADSRRFAEEAIKSDPSNVRAHWFLAIAADQLKDAEVALREYSTYLQLLGKVTPETATPAGYARDRLELLRKKP